MSQSDFNAAVKAAADFFSSLTNSSKNNKDALIITHIDCDGLAAAAIIVKVCKEYNLNYNLLRIRELNDQALNQIKESKENLVFFCDCGSSIVSKIDKTLNEKQVFIIDHHHLEEKDNKQLTLKELNPKAFDLHERRTIASSGIAYLFARELVNDNSLLPLALIGAIGDAQEDQGFIGYNEEFLKQAEEVQEIQTKNTLRLFGRHTRPILKSLQYSMDIPMKGITNDRDGCLDLLQELQIPKNRFGRRVTLDSLTKEEEEMLTEECLKRMTNEVKEKAFWNEYTLLNRPKGSQTRNLREFSTLLNACGRLDDVNLGIRICLGDKSAEFEAKEKRTQYRQSINQAKQWVDENKDQIISEDNLVIINGKEHIPADIAGTIASIFSKSGYYKEGTTVCVLARTDNNQTKISTRTTSKTANLEEALKEIINKLGGSSGGHKNAAGAVIDQDKEEEFVKELKKLF